MNKTDAPPTPADVFHLLRSYPLRWLVPAITVAMLAAVFTAVWPRSWVATQGLIVRNAATNAQWETPGKFRLDNELKVTTATESKCGPQLRRHQPPPRRVHGVLFSDMAIWDSSPKS